MAEWFEDWFNTGEYLDVYQHRNETDALHLVKLILNYTELKPHDSVLDLACGAGRHSILFAKMGFKVTGVDLSGNLLSVAKQNSLQLGLNINFIQADLRKFLTKCKFNLAVNLFTSFGYFKTDEENFLIFNNSFNSLKEDGYFAFDYFNKNYLINHLVKSSVEENDGKKIIQQREIVNGRVEKKITILKEGKQYEFFESVKLYNKKEIISELEKVGFKIKQVFGNFDGQIFDSEISPRLIIIAQR